MQAQKGDGIVTGRPKPVVSAGNLAEEIVKVGFIGVGNMGGPMCRNIIKRSNHQVTVFDLNPAAVKTCTDLGGTAAKSVADATKGADIVLTSLPMPKDVEKVALGDGGVLANIGKGQTYIDLSTNAPSMVQKIGAAFAAKGIPMLDAPVSGGTTGAEAATIAIMVGGDKKVFDDALPVLQSFSANVIHMGELGTGTVAKLCNNMLAFCNAAGTDRMVVDLDRHGREGEAYRFDVVGVLVRERRVYVRHVPSAFQLS